MRVIQNNVMILFMEVKVLKFEIIKKYFTSF